jgi:hypothetical protein
MDSIDKTARDSSFNTGKVVALIVLLVSQLSDCYTTLVGLEAGFKEANPLMRHVIVNYGYVSFFTVKVLAALWFYLLSRGYLRYALCLSFYGFSPGLHNTIMLFRLDVPWLIDVLGFTSSGVSGYIINYAVLVVSFFKAGKRKQEEIRKKTPPSFAGYVELTCTECGVPQKYGFKAPGYYGGYVNTMSFSSKSQVMSLAQERRCKEHSEIYREFLESKEKR